MQLLFERSTEFEGATGLGLLPGEVTPLRAPKLPHIGWNLVTFERESALTEGLGAAAAFYHVHSFACRPSEPGDVVGTRRVRRAVRLDRRARHRVRRPVPPREVLARRAGAARELRQRVREGRGVILYPAIDILDGKAVRLVQGRFEDQTVYNDDPASRRAELGRRGRALPARRRPRRRALGRAEVDRAPAPDHAAGPACRSSTAAGCARWPRCATRCAPAPSAPSSAPPRSATSTSSTTSCARSGRGSSSPSTCATG